METPVNNFSEQWNLHFLEFQHELKNPIQAIINACELLSSTSLNEEQIEYLAQLTKAVHLLSDITQQISDKDRTQMSVFSIYELVEELQLMLVQKAANKELDFQIQIADQLPEYWSSYPTKISRVLINLLDNAIKYASNGHVLLQVDAMNEGIQFVVKDTGMGIPQDAHKRVLSPLIQLDETQQGMGIGLYLVNELVKQLNGTLIIESQLSGGTEIQVVIPAKTAATPIFSETSPFLIDRQMTILLVEDHEISRTLLQQMIEKYFVHATSLTAKNGEEALAVLETEKIDLILIDLQMPVLDGISTLEAIRTNLGLSLPVIAVTAHGLPENHGFTDYLMKPFDPKQLIKLIEQHTSDQPTTNSIINLSYLDLMADGDELLKQLMLEMLLDELPTEIEKMSIYFEAASWKELRGVSHRMKTTLSFIGNQELSDINAHIEYYVKHQIHLEELPNLIGKINALLPALMQALKAAYAQLSRKEREVID